MLTRQQKKEIVDNVAISIKDGKSTTLINYKGVNANDMVSLKKSLYQVEAPLRIVKKSLIALAMKKAGIKDYDRRMFDGQIALAVSLTDEVSGPRVIADFAKENEGVQIVGGILDDTIISADKVIALAKLPSQDQLRAQLVGTLNAPVSGFVNVLSGNIRGLVTALRAVADQKA